VGWRDGPVDGLEIRRARTSRAALDSDRPGRELFVVVLAATAAIIPLAVAATHRE